MSLRRWLGLGMLLAATAFGGKGVYIFLKAQLAQVLLAMAWDQTQAGHEQARPWPWADTYPLARLTAPKQGADLIVLAGANGRTMAFGPGYLFGSARPGTAGNTVLSAHRDTHFAFLKALQPGDPLLLETADGVRHRYVVESAQIRDRLDTGALQPSDEPVLTLITCYPFDAIVPGGPLRYVVRARAETVALAQLANTRAKNTLATEK